MLERLPRSAAEDAVLVLRHQLGMSNRKSRSAAETIAQTVLYHAGLHEWAHSGGILAKESLTRMIGILNAGNPLPERQQAIRSISTQTSATEAEATKMLDLLLPIILGGVHQMAKRSPQIS